MKRYISDKTKILIYLFSLIFFAIMFFTSLVWLIIEYTIIGEILFWLGNLGTWIFIVLINMKTNNYKWKYVFLGKNYKEQVEKFFEIHNDYSNKTKRKIIKSMKNIYRKTGSIHYAVDKYIETPYNNWSENNHAFNYGNALEQQKMSYLLFALQLNIRESSALYDFFEYISIEPFTYEEYCTLIKNCFFFTDEIKNILLNKEYQEIFEFFKNANTSEDYINKITLYQEKLDGVLNDYVDLILENSEIYCLLEFFDEKIKDKLPKNPLVLFMSKDGTRRICICFDKETNTYRIYNGEFVFTETDKAIIYSEGQWIDKLSSSLFETVDLAINEIKKEYDEYIQIEL